MASASCTQRPVRHRHSRWLRMLTSMVSASYNTYIYVRYVRIRTKIRTNTYEYEMTEKIHMCTYRTYCVRIAVRIAYVFSYVLYVFVRIRTYFLSVSLCVLIYVRYVRYVRIHTKIRTQYVRIHTNTYAIRTVCPT